MFVEIRKQGKNKKYYLVHTYRIGDKVKRLSRYLGSNLTENKLKILRKRAEELLLKQIEDRNLFDLSTEEIKAFRKYDENR